MLVHGLGLALGTINVGLDLGTQGLGLRNYGLDLGLVTNALALSLRPRGHAKAIATGLSCFARNLIQIVTCSLVVTNFLVSSDLNIGNTTRFSI